MSGSKRGRAVAVFAAAWVALAAGPSLRAAEPEANPQAVAKAIASLRHIDAKKLSEAEQTRKAAEVELAWTALRMAGKAGVTAIRGEIDALDKSGEKDDFFKLNATALLWQMSKLEEADTIARVWAATPLETQYNYVFYSAFEAAQTQDPRALPMLKACLRDKKGSVFLERHFLDVKWPLTHAFLWGAFGPKGMPALDDVLGTSQDPTELLSAVILISKAHYLPALPRIRKLATHKDQVVRLAAIEMLGIFGHPQDYDFLVAGLGATDPTEVFAHAYALFEYEDLRAVPHLIPLLDSAEHEVREEVLSALLHLLNPASLQAIKSHAEKATIEAEKKACGDAVASVLKDAQLTWEAFAAKTADERAALLAAVRAKAEEPYRMKADDRTLTHAQLLEAAQEWKKRRTIEGGDYSWVYERHVLSAATPEDLDLLLDVKAYVYRRLSDECLYEIETLDKIVKRLGRSRYRAVVGVCEKVEARKP